MKTARRRLKDRLDRLPTWRYALTLSTFCILYVVTMVIIVVALHHWRVGHVDLAFGATYGALVSVVSTITLTVSHHRRQQRKRQAATSEGDGGSGGDLGYIQRTSLHDLFRTDENSRG